MVTDYFCILDKNENEIMVTSSKFAEFCEKENQQIIM